MFFANVSFKNYLETAEAGYAGSYAAMMEDKETDALPVNKEVL